MIVVSRIRNLEILDVMEESVVLPLDDSFIMHGIRNSKCLKDTWSSGYDTVFCCLDAVLDFHLSVLGCNKSRKSLLHVIFLPFSSAGRCIPCVMSGYGSVGGIL